jgi:DNA-cytosine methyltransferase
MSLSKEEGINVLSLFDGMSCGQIALQKAGIKVNKYFASEIDEHAIKVTQHNFPNTVQLGDVKELKSSSLPKIDLLIGGSPCQSFSVAGDGSGFSGKSKLFFEFVRILKEVNPTYFLLENVKMKKEWENIITEHLGVQPIGINSSNFVAQNRPRLYWSNFKIEKPKEQSYQLKDFLLDDNDESIEKFKLSEKAIDYMNRLRNGKPRWNYHTNPLNGNAACLTANMYKGIPYGVIKEKLRKLTPVECERLQGVPDNYTNVVSNTQRLRMLGNGWTVNVIEYIFSQI